MDGTPFAYVEDEEDSKKTFLDRIVGSCYNENHVE